MDHINETFIAQTDESGIVNIHHFTGMTKEQIAAMMDAYNLPWKYSTKEDHQKQVDEVHRKVAEERARRSAGK